jgi:membrane-associated phospholipid phosphatase
MLFWNNLDWVLPLRTPFLNCFFELITLAGYPLFLILFLCFGYFALGSKRFFHAAMLLMVAGLLNSWLKDFGQDARPAGVYALDGRVGDSYGWPSGHTQIAVVLWGYLAYTLKTKWAVGVAGLIICLQGFSRMYLGVHDPGDVAAGFVFGVACLAAYIAIEQHPKSSARLGAFSGIQMLGVLLILHLGYVMIYPAHAGHEAPFWFMGAMSGWLIGRYARGHEEVFVSDVFVWRVLVATLLTTIAFVLLTVLSRLPGYLAEDNSLVLYGSGALFGIAITGLLPLLLVWVLRLFDKRALKPS